MRLVDSDDYKRQTERIVLHSNARFTPAECRELFEEMVKAEARNGRLSARRRKRIIQYAAALQLTPMQASRIVTKVCRDLGQETAMQPPLLYRAVEQAAKPHRWPIWLILTIAVVTAIVLGQLVHRLPYV